MIVDDGNGRDAAIVANSVSIKGMGVFGCSAACLDGEYAAAVSEKPILDHEPFICT